MTALTDALTEVVGAEQVLTSPDVVGSYVTDWTGRFTGATPAVVRPGSTAEVAAVVQVCARFGAAIVPQGGNTGLVAGGVPLEGEVVVSLRRLSSIGEVDVAAGQVTVGAGAVLSDVQRCVRAYGLDVGTDFAARDSATIGGLVATNAGGLKVLRYGSVREQVVGLECVFANGTVLSRLGGLAKDNTGYDLSGLVVGSEGTLAVVTAVRLWLVPVLPARAVALVAVKSVAAAQGLLAAARTLPSLTSAEFFLADGLALVCAASGLGRPFGEAYPVYVVLDCTDRRDPAPDLLDLLEGAEVLDAAVGTDAAERRRLWTYREAHTEAINAAGVPVKLDVCVPAAAFADFIEELPTLVDSVAPGARTILFGHLAECNVHVNVLDAGSSADAVSDAVLGRVSELGGSISSEHGVGRAKAGHLGLSRTPVEIAAMRTIKKALDPDNLFNPGVIWPVGTT